MTLREFIIESNRIEGILRAPTPEEETAHAQLLRLLSVSLEDVASFVRVIQPDAVLRNARGLNVRVGDHVPPPGGPPIESKARELLGRINAHALSPYAAHVEYETLHPFTDGNGRSGRALWLWQMEDRVPGSGLALGFLHRFYYQTLSASRGPTHARA